MHFHLPKPLHGWREFAGEVGIIVIGVLIALSFEQLAVTIQNRANAHEAREAVRAEVSENLWWIQDREDYEPCIDGILSDLAIVLARARDGLPTPMITNFDLPTHSKITSLRWEANSQAGRASLFPEDEQRVLGNMYFTTEEYRASQEEEATIWSKIGFVVGLKHFTVLDIHDLGVLLAEARYRNFRAKLDIKRANQWGERLRITAANPNPVEHYNLSATPDCPSITSAPPGS
ncbi:MAG TPA: hypothetical protein VHS33_04180 [Sphingomicrobium sp.]|jgi:hypothetical protein|nr:hypothetical protein [Sphingomicrobium sp.]